MEIIGILSPIDWCFAPFVIISVVGIIALIGYFFTRLVKYFWCGEASGIGIPKKMSNKKEGYRECVMNYDSCDKCKEKWDKGAVIIEASTEPINERPAIQKGVYPTGVWWVVKRELLDSDIYFVTKEIAKEMGLYDEIHKQ